MVARKVKNPPAMQETGSDPRVGKIPWRRECNPLQYSCQENPTDRGAWWATVHGVTKSRTELNDEHKHSPDREAPNEAHLWVRPADPGGAQSLMPPGSLTSFLSKNTQPRGAASSPKPEGSEVAVVVAGLGAEPGEVGGHQSFRDLGPSDLPLQSWRISAIKKP